MSDLGNIKAIILDKDGVFVDFYQLWLRIIGARAQILAEYTTETWENFNYVRSMCIRSMGVDEDDESIDPNSPVAMPFHMVKLAVTTGLFLSVNHLKPEYTWQDAMNDVERSNQDLQNQLNIKDLVQEVPGSIDKIKELAKDYKLAVYSSDSEANVKSALEKFEIVDLISHIKAGTYKSAAEYQSICEKMGLKAEETLFITDSPVDVNVGKAAGAKVAIVMTGVLKENYKKLDEIQAQADLVFDALASFEINQVIAS
jgi:HAD superfamily hydrolase (TIGR01549 family)